jgi:hypothetical protein
MRGVGSVKRLAVILCGLMVSVMVAAANTPPPLPWFHSALTSFVKEPRVLVLGWSKDGKAAVISPSESGERGGTGFDLWVLDTVEDTVLKAVDIWSDEFDGVGDSDDAFVQAAETSQKARFFLEALADAAIEPADPKPLELSSFPLSTPNSQYTAGALTLPVGDQVEGTPAKTLDWRLVVRSTTQGEKTIAQGREENAIDVTVKGYVLSPSEPRILVIYGIKHLGFEGEQPLSYAFSGCLLTRGFTQK